MMVLLMLIMMISVLLFVSCINNQTVKTETSTSNKIIHGRCASAAVTSLWCQPCRHVIQPPSNWGFFFFLIALPPKLTHPKINPCLQSTHPKIDLPSHSTHHKIDLPFQSTHPKTDLPPKSTHPKIDLPSKSTHPKIQIKCCGK